MFAAVLTFILATTASAFVLNGKSSRSMVTMMAEKSKSVPFLTVPQNCKGLVGSKEFDPLGFSDQLDIRWLQEAEIKHSRIAMLAFAGWIASELGIRLPDHDYGAIAAHDIAVKSGSGYQVLTAIVGLEFISTVALKQMYEGSGRKPGEFGFDPLGFYNGKSDSVKASMEAKELENGRTAMLAFAGLVTAAVSTGKPFPYI